MFASERVPAALQALGLGLGAVMLVETSLVLSDGTLEPSFLVGAGTALPFAAGLVYGGRYLRRSSLSTDRFPRVLGWCLGGLAGFVLVNVVLMVAIPPDSALFLVGWLRWAATLGSGIGLVIGLFEARSIERTARAEHEAVRAEAERARRELLDDLTHLLRHEVLNASQAIDGYADKIQRDHELDDSVRDDLAVIQRRATDLAATIEEIRTLVDANRSEPGGGTADLEKLLRETVADLRDRTGAADVDVDVEADLDAVTVRGAAVLPSLFSDLLTDAADRDGEAPAHVTVTARTTATTVEVRIATDGSAPPDAEREGPFERESPLERPSEHSFDVGASRPLVETVAEQYGVTVERPADGTENATVVELPRASDGDADRSVES